MKGDKGKLPFAIGYQQTLSGHENFRGHYLALTTTSVSYSSRRQGSFAI